MSEEVLLISNLKAQCKWLLRAMSDRLLAWHSDQEPTSLFVEVHIPHV